MLPLPVWSSGSFMIYTSDELKLKVLNDFSWATYRNEQKQWYRINIFVILCYGRSAIPNFS